MPSEAQPVDTYKLPSWLKALLTDFVTRERWDLDWSLDSELMEEVVDELCPGADWFTNWGTSEGNFVCEPYGFDAESAASLNKFCSTLGGLTWKVDSGAWLNPGKTVRVTIYPKKQWST